MAASSGNPDKMAQGPQSAAMPAGEEPKAAPQKRDLMLEIWTLVAIGVLVHGDCGSYRGVHFAVHLQGLQHKKRILALNPTKEGFPEEKVKTLMSEPFKLFYEGPEGESEGSRKLVMTCPSSLKLAADWKARGFVGVPKTGANDAFGSPIFFFHTLNGKPNRNGPLVLGSIRDAVTEKIRWNPETGSSIHGTLEQLNQKFEEAVVRLPRASKKEGAKPQVWVQRTGQKRGGSAVNKLKRKWAGELGGLKKRVWEGGSALRRDLKRKRGQGDALEGRSKVMQGANDKVLGSSQGRKMGQTQPNTTGGGAGLSKGPVASKKEGTESTTKLQHGLKASSAKAEGLKHEKKVVGSAPEVGREPQERCGLEGNAGGGPVDEEKERSAIGSLKQASEKQKQEGKDSESEEDDGGNDGSEVQKSGVQGDNAGVKDTHGGGTGGPSQANRERVNNGQAIQAEVGSGKQAGDRGIGLTAVGGERERAKPAMLVKGPGLRLRISLKDLPGPVAKVPRHSGSVAPQGQKPAGLEGTTEQFGSGVVGAKLKSEGEKDEVVECRGRLPGTAAERGSGGVGESSVRGDGSPVEPSEAIKGQAEAKRRPATEKGHRAEGGTNGERSVLSSEALGTSRSDIVSAREGSEPDEIGQPQTPDSHTAEARKAREKDRRAAFPLEPLEDAEAVRELVRKSARTKLFEMQLVTGRYRDVERALLELLKAPDCRPEFKVELKLALRQMREGDLLAPPRWERLEEAAEKECPKGFEEMRAERSRSGGAGSLQLGSIFADGARDVIAGVTVLGPAEKMRTWREARVRKMTSARVAPVFVPSRGRADLAYLNFEAECALGPRRVGETPVVVFVRGDELEAYRARWPELLFAILPSGQGCSSIGGVRNTMKRFAAAAGLSHYWEIDDNVMGFVAGPERRHVAMWEALLYGQRQMLECAGERVGVFGFECWKGLDDIPEDGDLFLKANSASIYKVRLIDCHVTAGMRYRPFLHSKEDILFNAEFTCRGGRTLKSLWFRYVRSFWSQGGCHDARNPVQITSVSGVGGADNLARSAGTGAGEEGLLGANASGPVEGSEKTVLEVRLDTAPEKAAAVSALFPAVGPRPQFLGVNRPGPLSGAQGGWSIPKVDSGVAGSDRLHASAAGSLEPRKRLGPLNIPASVPETEIPGPPSEYQPAGRVQRKVSARGGELGFGAASPVATRRTKCRSACDSVEDGSANFVQPVPGAQTRPLGPDLPVPPGTPPHQSSPDTPPQSSAPEYPPGLSSPGTPPRGGSCSNNPSSPRETVSIPPKWGVPKALEEESDGSDDSAGESESEAESEAHFGSPPRSFPAPLREAPAPLTPPPVTPRKQKKRPSVKAERSRPAWMERSKDDEDLLGPAVAMTGAELAAALQSDVTLTEAYVKEQRALRKRGRLGGLSGKLKAAEKQRQLLAKLDKLLEMGTYSIVKRKKVKRRAVQEDHDLWECPGDMFSGHAQGKTRAKIKLAEAADITVMKDEELRETHREIMAVADRLGKKGRLRKSPFGGQVILRLARLLASRNARVHQQAARTLSDLAGRCDVTGCARRVEGFRKAARDALGFLVDHWELFRDERFGMRLIEVNKLFRLGLIMFRRRVLTGGFDANVS